MSSTPSRPSRRTSSTRLQDSLQGSNPAKASPTPRKRTPGRRVSAAASIPSNINSIALTFDERALAAELHISATCFLLVSETYTDVRAPQGLIGSKYSTERKVRIPIGEFLYNNGRITKRRLDGQRTDDQEEGRGGDLDPSDDELDFEVVVEVDERGRGIPQSERSNEGGRSVRARLEAEVVENRAVEGKGKGKEREREREEPMIEIVDEDSEEEEEEEEEDEEGERRAAEGLAALFVQKVKEAEAQAAMAASSLKGTNNVDSLWPTPPSGSQPKASNSTATLPPSSKAAPAIASSSKPARPIASSSTTATSSKPIQPSPPLPHSIASTSKATNRASIPSNPFPPMPSSSNNNSNSKLVLNPLIPSSPAQQASSSSQPTPTSIPKLVYLSLYLQTYRAIIKNISSLQPELYPTSNGEKWKAAVMKVLNGDKRIRRKGLDRFTWKYGRGPGTKWDV